MAVIEFHPSSSPAGGGEGRSSSGVEEAAGCLMRRGLDDLRICLRCWDEETWGFPLQPSLFLSVGMM